MDRFVYEIWDHDELVREVTIEAETLEEADEQVLKQKEVGQDVVLTGFTGGV